LSSASIIPDKVRLDTSKRKKIEKNIANCELKDEKSRELKLLNATFDLKADYGRMKYT